MHPLSPLQREIVSLMAEHFGVSPDEIRPEMRLLEDLGADSLALLDFVLGIEDRYEASIRDDEVQRLRSVADVLALVQKYEPDLKRAG